MLGSTSGRDVLFVMLQSPFWFVFLAITTLVFVRFNFFVVFCIYQQKFILGLFVETIHCVCILYVMTYNCINM